jgi:FKBP-type peptidyl-prolyl cis-trans isomerase
MKLILIATALFCCVNLRVQAQKADLPDSVKAMQLLSTITVEQSPTKGRSGVGLSTAYVKIELENEGKDKEVVFRFPKGSKVVATGIDVEAEDDELEWDYDWQLNQPYQLLIAIANDSASNMVLYSGYIFLPELKQWKFLGTCKLTDNWRYISNPAIYQYAQKKRQQPKWKVQTNSFFAQRSNGRWKNLLAQPQDNPVVSVTNHVDSAAQYTLEIKNIDQRIANQTTDVKNNVAGVYYTMMKEGTGQLVKVTDTVEVFYKGYLFDDNAIFDQTKDKTATFPLSRLIKGWQLGLPMCRVGGKIKLVIPSAIGYSNRTRSPKIPPNSILVFEIEVVSVK